MRKSRQREETFQKINIELERLNVAIITRYPDSTRAAEEYAALRRGVMAMASASTLHRQSLIGLINSIDDGATIETMRGKIVDLLSTLMVHEIPVNQLNELPRDQLTLLFDEVGDQAHERSAWIQKSDGGVDVTQKGYVRRFPPQERPQATISSGLDGHADQHDQKDAPDDEDARCNDTSGDTYNQKEDSGDAK